MDRRALFFLVAAVAAAVLYPFAPTDLRWVSVGVSITYFVLALLAALDAWSRNRPSDRGPSA
ncbi:MAG TPA: hypothetical protein VF230_06210 [Acidimicrobiales bacterium]